VLEAVASLSAERVKELGRSFGFDRVGIARAGLGWTGKNTCLIDLQSGSWFFLGIVVTDLDLEADRSIEDHCAGCNRCLEVCPTGALREPYLLDANRCLSYWTIEHRGAVASEIRPHLKTELFGCDICQEVCPWNRWDSLPPGDPALAGLGRYEQLDLGHLMEMGEEEYRLWFKGSPIKRARREGLRRNTILLSANLGRRDLLPKIRRCLDDPDEGVREAAAWALERLNAFPSPCPLPPKGGEEKGEGGWTA
jgi:epoxyqueuosine reductase